jgi:hypothetical protein
MSEIRVFEIYLQVKAKDKKESSVMLTWLDTIYPLPHIKLCRRLVCLVLHIFSTLHGSA